MQKINEKKGYTYTHVKKREKNCLEDPFFILPFKQVSNDNQVGIPVRKISIKKRIAMRDTFRIFSNEAEFDVDTYNNF